MKIYDFFVIRKQYKKFTHIYRGEKKQDEIKHHFSSNEF